jgi:hypothetical protein
VYTYSSLNIFSILVSTLLFLSLLNRLFHVMHRQNELSDYEYWEREREKKKKQMPRMGVSIW